MRFMGVVIAAALACGPAAAQTLLVGNKGEDTLSFIDLASGRELGRAATGRMPHEIAVSPDGTQAAVVAYGGTSIDVFDVRRRAKLRTIELAPNQGPHGLVWLADGRLIATTERSQSLTIVDTRRRDAVTAIRTDQQGTHMVAVSPDGRRAYTANMAAGTVSVIDLVAGAKLRDVAVGGMPEGLALSADGRELWVADLEGGRVQAFDIRTIGGRDRAALAPVVHLTAKVGDGAPGEIERSVARPIERELRNLPGVTAVTSSIRNGETWLAARFRAGGTIQQAAVQAAVRRAGTAFPKGRTEIETRVLGTLPLATIPTGPRPIRVAASPDGRWIVTSNFGDGSLTVIDARSRKAVRTVPVSGDAAAQQVTILFSRDGKRLYAAETGRDQIAEVELASGRVLRRLGAGKNGDGLAIAR